MKKKALLLMLFMMFISTSALSQNTIYGTVTGDVQEGVTITLKSVSPGATETTTVGDGTYSFTELENGDYTVTPSLAGYSFAPENTEVTITGPSVPQVDFVSVADEQDDDIDDDGVINEKDECESTSVDAIVDPSNGCSIEQLVPCNGNWKNHGQYESAFTQTVNSFIKQKLIAKEEKGALMKEVASSDCGKLASEYTVVCDPGTSLCWQDPQREAYNYADQGMRAFEADQYCRELILGGFEDWRVPTIAEIRSITAGFLGTETGGACPVVDGNITYGEAQFSLDCFNLDNSLTGKGPGDNGCYLKPGFTGTCDKYDPYGGHPLEHVAFERPSGEDDVWRGVLMFENGSVLFNHACTLVDVRCVRDDDGSPIVECVERKKKEACNPGKTKNCECSGFGDRPDGIQTCNESGNCWGPCECTKSVIDTSVDAECHAGNDLYDSADILTVNIRLPKGDTISYDPADLQAFLYRCPVDTTPMPQSPPDGGSWENLISNPGQPPYSMEVRGISYYRESLIADGRYCLIVMLNQLHRMPPIPKPGDYWKWDATQGIVFPLDGGAQTVDVTLEYVNMPDL